MILDRNIDDDIKDNLRMALLQQIAIPGLEKANKNDVI